MNTQYLSDLHLHSSYSFDGHVPLVEICEQAIRMGLSEIAITDHADIYSDRPYEHILNADALYADLQQVRDTFAGRLTVRLGAELGQPQRNPADAKRFLDRYPLDFVIGSIHNIEQDFDIYDLDYTSIDCTDMYMHYLEWVLDLAANYDYDVLGHITYPLRCMAEAGIQLDLAPFTEQLREIFSVVVSRKKGIELNTSGLYQTIRDTFPPISLLRLYRECGGTIITIGSDAHKTEHIGLPIREGIERLKAAGFTEYHTFSARQPIAHPIR